MEIGQAMAKALIQRTDEGNQSIESRANTELLSPSAVVYKAESAKVTALDSSIQLMKLEEAGKLVGMGEDFVAKAEGELSSDDIAAGSRSLKNVIEEVEKLDKDGMESLTDLKSATDAAVLNTELAIGTWEDFEAEFNKLINQA